VYGFHVEFHPNYTWYAQCVDFGSFPSEAWHTSYLVFGIVMIYLLPLVIIIVTYAIIIFTIIKKSQNNGQGMDRATYKLR
jgi:gonadotropin-releasing hormone receptor